MQDVVMTPVRDSIHREITPLKEDDCFLVFDRQRSLFTYPIHFHPEYEINFIANARGARRVVGDSIEEIDDYELVMVGPNLYHGWKNFRNTGKVLLHEITIQFPRDIFGESLIAKNMLKPIRDLLNNAQRGLSFSKETARQKAFDFAESETGLDSFTISIAVVRPATSRGQRLCNLSFQHTTIFYDERIEKIYNYVRPISVKNFAGRGGWFAEYVGGLFQSPH